MGSVLPTYCHGTQPAAGSRSESESALRRAVTGREAGRLGRGPVRLGTPPAGPLSSFWLHGAGRQLESGHGDGRSNYHDSGDFMAKLFPTRSHNFEYPCQNVDRQFIAG